MTMQDISDIYHSSINDMVDKKPDTPTQIQKPQEIMDQVPELDSRDLYKKLVTKYLNGEIEDISTEDELAPPEPIAAPPATTQQVEQPPTPIVEPQVDAQAQPTPQVEPQVAVRETSVEPPAEPQEQPVPRVKGPQV